MKFTGNIRKMRSKLIDNKVEYRLPLFDILKEKEEIPMNELIGKEISIAFRHTINCVVTGKKINKTFGEGMSYDAFMKSPMACPSIIRPELSQIHNGIALRDETWEREHHLKPHYVYLSRTSGLKVGVTRATQVPTRWIDQGATEAVLLAETPYRQAAGLIEVSLKTHIADKTNWRTMLKNETTEEDILIKKEALIPFIPAELQKFVTSNNTLTNLEFPVLQYPEKVKSSKLDKAPFFTEKLMGIKGQYFIFDDDTVMNMRSHAGYEIELSY